MDTGQSKRDRAWFRNHQQVLDYHISSTFLSCSIHQLKAIDIIYTTNANILAHVQIVRYVVLEQADNHPAPGTGTPSLLRSPGRVLSHSKRVAAHAAYVSRIGGAQGSALKLWLLL